MAVPATHERTYVAWQNRALHFYLGARLLHRNELYLPAAYSATMALELFLKATLIYWDRSFDPLSVRHGMAKLTRMVRNKVCNAKDFAVPPYFYHEQRYLHVSRYPAEGKGVTIPAFFVEDLDRVFADIICLVPFQHNTQLKRALCGKDRSALLTLRHKNQQMRRLRKLLQVQAR